MTDARTGAEHEDVGPAAEGWWWGAVVVTHLVVSAALVYDYLARIVAFDLTLGRLGLHDFVVDGTVESPYRYRVLVPFLLDPFIDHQGSRRLRLESFDSVYRVYFIVALAATLLVITRIGRRYVEPNLAFAGSLLVAACLPIALRDHAYQAWSLIEPVFVGLAVLAVSRPRTMGRAVAGAVALTVVATLNRETGFVIALVYLAPVLRAVVSQRRIDVKAALPAIAAAVTWCVVFLGVRWIVGPGTSVDYGVVDALNHGPGRTWMAFRNAGLLMGAVAVLCVVSVLRRRADGLLLWIAAVVLPPYLLSVYLYGVWVEVRLLVPLFPILVPIALGAFATGRPPRTATIATPEPAAELASR